MKKGFIVWTLTLALLLSVWAPTMAEEKILSDKTLVVGTRGEAINLYPMDQNDASSGPIVHLTHNQLVVSDPVTGEISPCLAESWEQIDEYTYRLYLRKDVVSHAGDPFTAHDVVTSFKRGGKSTVKAYVWDPFDCEATVAVDDYTVDIKTKEPYAPAMRLLADNGQGIMMIVEKSLVDQGDETDYSRNPVGGTGPWVLKEWIAGDRVILERNENYWGEKPYYKTLVLRNITDDITRAMALESGDIDICLDVTPSQVPNLQDNESIALYHNKSFTTNYIGINCKNEILSDLRVRQALCYAMDRDAIVQLAYGGIGRPADAMLPPEHECYIPAEGDLIYHYDLDKAKELLAEAGYADGFTINLWANENQTRIDLAEMLQNMWSQLGITVNVEIMEWGAYLEKLGNGEHDMFILGYACNGNDGDYLHDTWYTSDSYLDNYQGWSNPRFDELVDAARVEFDHEKRLEYYNEVLNLLRAELPTIPVEWNETTIAAKSYLKGVQPSLFAPMDYVGIYEDD